MSEMHSPDGRIFKASGQVIRVDPPRALGLTWAWHDDDGTRGHESQVLIELEPQGDMTGFKLSHTGLPDAESAQNHTGGWNSSLDRLERLFP